MRSASSEVSERLDLSWSSSQCRSRLCEEGEVVSQSVRFFDIIGSVSCISVSDVCLDRGPDFEGVTEK